MRNAIHNVRELVEERLARSIAPDLSRQPVNHVELNYVPEIQLRWEALTHRSMSSIKLHINTASLVVKGKILE
jgi:hypothetical protein